jgi:hypothetical protein
MVTPILALLTLASFGLADMPAPSAAPNPATSPATAPATNASADGAAGPSTQPKFADCPLAQPLTDKTGWSIAPRAKYRAEQVPSAVMIFVEGENPTAGYQMTLAVNPARVYPPELTLYRKPPGGMAAEVITPYAFCVQFGSGKEAIPQVTIFDADGKIEVPIEQARD